MGLGSYSCPWLANGISAIVAACSITSAEAVEGTCKFSKPATATSVSVMAAVSSMFGTMVSLLAFPRLCQLNDHGEMNAC